jgi:hypothetical protein
MFNAPKNSNHFPSGVASRIFNSIYVKFLDSIQKVKVFILIYYISKKSFIVF